MQPEARLLVAGFPLLALMGCSSGARAPIETVDFVDLSRFMGDWYVIGHIPTWIDSGAHNAVESYRLDEDGNVLTTFTFRDGSFDGKVKTYRPVALVKDTASNAVWGMRFIWPVEADYRVVFVSPDYQHTVIGREKRDYVWIMSRAPDIADADYEQLVKITTKQGYDISALRRVPQQWPVKAKDTALTQDSK